MFWHYVATEITKKHADIMILSIETNTGKQKQYQIQQHYITKQIIQL